MWTATFWQSAYLEAISLVIAHLAIMLHILISKHENPQQATFWLLLVAFLPGFGLLAYLLFGITSLKPVRMEIITIRQKTAPDGTVTAPRFAKLARSLKDFQITGPMANEPLIKLFDRLFPDHPALQGNDLEMLQDGIAVYPRMLEDIRNAQRCIRMQSYILNSDEVGQQFMDALAERAAAGVDVKVLFDSVGSFKSYFSQYFRRALRQNRRNLRIKSFSPINLFAPWKFQLRNHRKLLIVDGQVAYVGGVNISAENERLSRVPKSRYIHDLHCRITGPAVASFTASFFQDWLYTNRQHWESATVAGDFALPRRTGDAYVRVLPSGPGNVPEGTRKVFFSAAAMAQKSLWIMTPYFVPGEDYIDALCLAAARGVDVRLVVPVNNDHFLVDCAARNSYGKLLDAGVVIYEKLGIFSHAKAFLVDSEWGVMGSSNCDSRSFKLNFELDFCFRDKKFVSDLALQFHHEFTGSRKLTTMRLQKTHPLKKVLQYIAALFTPIL